MGCVSSSEKDASLERSRNKAPAIQPDAQPDIVTLATARLYQGFNLQHNEDVNLPEDQELEQQHFPGAIDNPERLSPSTPTSSRDALCAPLALHTLQGLPPHISAHAVQALPPEYPRQPGSVHSQPGHLHKEASHHSPTATHAHHVAQASVPAAAPSEADDDDVQTVQTDTLEMEQDPSQPGSTRNSRPSVQKFFKGMLHLSKRQRLVRFKSRDGAARESEVGAREDEACRHKQQPPMRHTSPGVPQAASNTHMQQHTEFLAHVAPPPNLNSYSAQSMRLHRVSRSGSRSGSQHGAAHSQGGSSFYKESFFKGSQFSYGGSLHGGYGGSLHGGYGGSLHGGSAFSNRSSPRTTPTSLTATSRALSGLTHASSAQLSKRHREGSSSVGNASGQLSCSLAQQGQCAFSGSLIHGSPEALRMLHPSVPGVDEIQAARGGVGGKPGQFWSASVRNSNLSTEDTSAPSLSLQEAARCHGYSEPGCVACLSSTPHAHSARGSPQTHIDHAPTAPPPPCPHHSNTCSLACAARRSSLPISVQHPSHHVEQHLSHAPAISPTSSFDRQPSALPPSRAASRVLSSPRATDPAASSWPQQQQHGLVGVPSEGSQHSQPRASAHAPHQHATSFNSNISRRSSQISSFAEPMSRRSSVHRGPSVLFSKNDVQVTGLPPSLLTSARGAQRQPSNTSSSVTPSSSGPERVPISGPQASTPFRIRNHRGSVESPRVAQGGTSISGALALHDPLAPLGAETHSSAHSSSHHSGGGTRSPGFLPSTSGAQIPPHRTSGPGARGPPVSSSCSHLPAHMLSSDAVGVGTGSGSKGCANSAIGAAACQRVRSLDITRPPCIWETTDQQGQQVAVAGCQPHRASVVSPPHKAFVLSAEACKRDNNNNRGAASTRAVKAMRMSGGGSDAEERQGGTAIGHAGTHSSCGDGVEGVGGRKDGWQPCDADGTLIGASTAMDVQHGPGNSVYPQISEGVAARGHAASPPPGPLRASSTQTLGNSSDFASGATALVPPTSRPPSPRGPHSAPSQQPFQNPFSLQNSGAQVHLLAQQPHPPHLHMPPVPTSPRPSMYGASSTQIQPPSTQRLFSSHWPHSMPVGDEVANEKLERARAEEALIAACRNALTNSANGSLARAPSNSTLHQQPSLESQPSGQPSVTPTMPSSSTNAANLTALASHPSAMGPSNADPMVNGSALATRLPMAEQVLGAPGKQGPAQKSNPLSSLPSLEPSCEAKATDQGTHPDAPPAQYITPNSMACLKRHLPPRCFSEGNLSFRNRRSEELARNASRGKQPSTPEHALPCWVAESSQAAAEQASQEPQRSKTYESSNANWAINSMPGALDEAYKIHLLSSSMGVDFVFDDEDEDGNTGVRGSSGSEEDDGGEVEFKYDMSGASRPEITLPSRFRSNTVGHQHPQPRSASIKRAHQPQSSQSNSRSGATKQRSHPARHKKRELGSLVLHGSGSAFSSGSGGGALNRHNSSIQSGPITESNFW